MLQLRWVTFNKSVLCDGASIDRGMCFISHYSLQVQLSSWPNGKSWWFIFHTENVTISALVFLNSGWSLGDGAEEWNPLAELCGKTCPVLLLVLVPEPELRGLFVEDTHLSWGMPGCHGLSFLAGGGKEMLWVFPNSAPRLRNPLWPLIFGSRLVRPTLTQPAAFGMRGLWLHIPLIPISALCYSLINKSCFFSPSFLFVFLCTFQFRFILFPVWGIGSGRDRSEGSVFLLDLELGAFPTVLGWCRERNYPQL